MCLFASFLLLLNNKKSNFVYKNLNLEKILNDYNSEKKDFFLEQRRENTNFLVLVFFVRFFLQICFWAVKFFNKFIDIAMSVLLGILLRLQNLTRILIPRQLGLIRLPLTTPIQLQPTILLILLILLLRRYRKLFLQN